MSRGYSTAINKTTNPQLAELQTSKQQIDHQLIDELLICQWKLMKIDELMMEYWKKQLDKRLVIDLLRFPAWWPLPRQGPADI